MKRSHGGFTLIELILVILVLAIVSTSITSFVQHGIGIYQDTAGRDKQISDSRFVIERITREIREALPNSVRVTADGQCVEFIPILDSSSYVDIPVLPDGASNTVTVVVSDRNVTDNAAKIVVYPSTTAHVYAASNALSGVVFDVASYGTVTANVRDITLDNTVLFNDDSPTARYFIIKDSVAYCQGGDNTIKRYQGHALTPIQASPPSGVGVMGILMAERQTNSAPFTLLSATLMRNAMVQMDFSFQYSDESLRLINEVHIANVP